jgi:hypothetical protein
VSVFDAPRDRPLLAPLFAALAAEVEQLDVDAFLADVGRRARIYADLWRTLRPDVLVVDSGSGWETDPTQMVDLLTRVKAVVDAPLGVTLRGATDVQRAIASARAAAQAGAGVIIVREDGVTPPDGYERATAPLWASLRFFRAAAVLQTPAPWGITGPLPCSPVADAGAYGLAVAPGEAPPAHDGRCVLLTHTTDLAGHVPVRDLQSVVARLRS